MSLSVADGVITAGADAVNTTYTVSGLSFQPKAIFFFWCGRATTGQGEADHNWGSGFATSTSSRRCYISQSDHGAAAAASDHARFNDCCIATLTVAGALASKIDLNAINSDGFQLIVDDNLPAGLVISWIAWGGSDITDVAIVDFSEPGSTGNQDISVGFALDTGQDDKAVIFLGGVDTAFGSITSWSNWMLGVAAGNSPVNAVLTGNTIDSSDPSEADTYCRNGDCVANLGTGAAVVSRASVSAWLSTGFRLNWAEVDGGTTWEQSALVIKGGRWNVGDATTSTGTSNQDEVVGIVPKGILLASHGKAQSTADTSQAVDERIVGVATAAASRSTAGMLQKDAANTMDIGIAHRNDAMYVNQSTASTITVEGLMDLVDFVVTGDGFTYVMDDADPSPAFFWYLACADAPVTGYTLDASPGSFSLSGVAASTIADRILSGDPGNYSLSGIAASLLRDYPLTVSPGAFALNGVDASFIADRMLDASPGSFVLTGTSASLLRDYFLIALPGAIDVAGVAASTLADRVLTLSPASFTVTGVDAGLLLGRMLDAGVGSFIITGADATLLYTPTGAYVLVAEPGSFTLTGVSAVLVADRLLNASPGTFVLTGSNADLLALRELLADIGVFSLMGFDSSLLADRILTASSGAFTVSGVAAELIPTIIAVYGKVQRIVVSDKRQAVSSPGRLAIFDDAGRFVAGPSRSAIDSSKHRSIS